MRLSDWLRRLRNSSKRKAFHQRPTQLLSNAEVGRQIEELEDRTLLTLFVVDSTADTIDANDGFTTLREAIIDANANAGADTIHFNIPGSGVHTIQPGSALPTINGNLTIDGTSQPGFDELPLIEIDGSNAGTGVDGLRISNGNSIIRGLIINRFGGRRHPTEWRL